MRHIGPYDNAETPSLDDLVSLFSGDDRLLLDSWIDQFRVACAAFNQSLPSVHNLAMVVGDEAIRRRLAKTWDSKPKAAKIRLQRMIVSLPAHDQSLCAFCNLSEDPELDHFLPKSAYPEFAFHHRNLMPICGICNKRKSVVVRNTAGDRVILAPLWEFENISRIIVADLIYGTAISSKFSVVNNQNIVAETFAIAKRHFRRLDLANRYAKRANAQLSTVVRGLKGETEEVARKTLIRWSRPPQFPITANSWDVALKAAIASQIDPIVAWLLTKGLLAP